MAEHRELLARRGAIVPSWRSWRGKKSGPYFLLLLRDEHGSGLTMYLGVEGPVVAVARTELAQLQTRYREHRAACRVMRQLRRELRRAKKELDRQLLLSGLSRNGMAIPDANGPVRQTGPTAPREPPPARPG